LREDPGTKLRVNVHIGLIIEVFPDDIDRPGVQNDIHPQADDMK